MDAKQTAALDLLLPALPYYGEFTLPNRVDKIKNEKFDEVWKNLGNPFDQMYCIKEYLVENGFAIMPDKIENEYSIELTERGRWLKQSGSMESYRQYQVQKKEKKAADDAWIEYQKKQDALQYTRDGLQYERDRRLYWINFCIAVSTTVAAIYYVLEILNHFYHIYPSLPKVS